MSPESVTSSETSEAANSIRNDLFSLTSLPGKGKGLIATSQIQPGTCIISESPLFTTAEIASVEVERELGKILKALPKDSQRAFLSLHNNNPGREPLSNIVRTNAYPLGASSDVGGIFPNVARINHSCLPNTVQAWNAVLLQETVHVVRNIEKGDEITISYSIGGTSDERKSKLKEFFGFDCTCEMCSLTGTDLELSDKRQLKARELDESIGNPKRVKTTPEMALADCRQLLKLYNEEGIADTRIPRLYYDAFQICIMHGDQARAKVFAQKCSEARKLCEGPDSVDAREMSGYASFPSSHDSFGGSSKWRQAADAVPTDMDRRTFEKWLWRECQGRPTR